MNYLLNALASHEVAVARYYYKRGAYVAAANRGQNTLTRYPQAPANEEALVIMAMSYDKLGLMDLRDDAERVLVKNFPKRRTSSGAIPTGSGGRSGTSSEVARAALASVPSPSSSRSRS